METNFINGAVNAVAAGARSISRYMPEPVARGIDFVESMAGANAPDTSAISSNTRELINQQIELQREMLQVTLFSNLERTKHETQMAPARNIRLS